MSAAAAGALRLLELDGTARERGRAHGEALRPEIERGLERFREHVPGAVAADESAFAGYLAAAARFAPGPLEELRGIAEGSAASFALLLAYNLADELRVFAAAERCTSVGLRGRAGRPPLSGQTMDSPAWFAETPTVLRSAEAESGLTTVVFTLAGLLALCGANSAGLAVWCNALSPLPASPSGLPVAFLVRRLLCERALAAAGAVAEGVPHACGQHYLLGAPDGLVSLECSAARVVEARPRGAAVWHANHPVAHAPAAGAEPGASSAAREAFAARTLARASSRAELEELLADRSTPICKLAGDGGDSVTLFAALAEHGRPPRLRASAGPPSEHGFAPIALEPVAGSDHADP